MIETKFKCHIIQLTHTKSDIYGFGFSSLSSIFWWYNDTTIVYHIDECRRTHYLKLPEGINRNTHKISQYLENSNSLLFETN